MKAQIGITTGVEQQEGYRKIVAHCDGYTDGDQRIKGQYQLTQGDPLKAQGITIAKPLVASLYHAELGRTLKVSVVLEQSFANEGTCRWVIHLCVGAVQVDLQMEGEAVGLQATDEAVEVVVEVLALLGVLLGPKCLKRILR